MAAPKYVDLTTTEVLPAALERVPESVARREHILPLTFDGERLTVVVSEPPSSETLERLRFALNCPVAITMAPHEAIRGAIEQYYGSTTARKVAKRRRPIAEPIEFIELPDDEPNADRPMLDPDSPAVVRMVQGIIGEALHLTASRILILPVRNRLKVAYRIADAVYTREDAPREMHYPILVRLMTMTNLSGVIKVHIGEKELALQSVFKPSQFGLLALIEVGGDAPGPEHWRARAKRLGYPFLELDARPVSTSVLALLPEPVVRHHRCLPVSMEGNVLTVAVSAPPEPELLEQLRFLTGRSISVVLTPAGALLAAIDRHYGAADSETSDLILWELAQAPQAPLMPEEPAAGSRGKPTPAARQTARALLDYLHTVYHDKMLALFEQVRTSMKLCRRAPETGELDVVFLQSHLTEHLPPEARHYIEDRIWALREAVIARLESFVAGDPLARGIAMTYALYLAACALREGRRPVLDPGTRPDAWLNFLYAFAIRAFPAVQSNGALLALVMEQMDQLSGRIARLADDSKFVKDSGSSRQQLTRLAAQTAADELLDSGSRPVVHLVDLLLSEAVHPRASCLALVPQEDGVEVAFRVQGACYTRERLPLKLHYPVLARLSTMTEANGQLLLPSGTAQWEARVAFHATPCGMAAAIDIPPRRSAVQASRAMASRHRFEFIDLSEFTAPPDLLRIVPLSVLQSKCVLPLDRDAGGVLKVALSAPPSPRQSDALRLAFNSLISVAIAPEDELLAALYRHRHTPAEPGAISPEAVALLGTR